MFAVGLWVVSGCWSWAILSHIASLKALRHAMSSSRSVILSANPDCPLMNWPPEGGDGMVVEMTMLLAEVWI